MEKKYTPCGGCGATEPMQRCIGCLHPFDPNELKDISIDLIELPEPVGKFILDQKDLSPAPGRDGSYWHYNDVITLLTRYLEYKKEQPKGPVWVKASEFKYEVGTPYHAKDSQSKGAGRFDENGDFTWGDSSVTHANDQDDLLILDESQQTGG